MVMTLIIIFLPIVIILIITIAMIMLIINRWTLMAGWFDIQQQLQLNS